MQQVNLYLKEFRPKFDPFAARPALAVSGMVILLMAIWAALSINEVNKMHAASAIVAADTHRAEEKLGRLKGLGKLGDKTQLEESANQVRTAIENRVYIKQLISNNTFGNDQGFSVLMTVLAKSALKDLVLSDFGLSAGGRTLYLHGKTTRVDAVPEFIRALQQGGELAKVSFGALKLVKTTGGQMEFSLGEWDEKTMGAVGEPINQASALDGRGR